MIGGSMGVAGVLDLLRIPYTGGGPGEIYLQEDKSLSKKLLDFEDVKYPDFASFAPQADQVQQIPEHSSPPQIGDCTRRLQVDIGGGEPRRSGGYA